MSLGRDILLKSQIQCLLGGGALLLSSVHPRAWLSCDSFVTLYSGIAETLALPLGRKGATWGTVREGGGAQQDPQEIRAST